jgi:Na+/proline symporter
VPETAALATVDIIIVLGFLVVVTIVGYAMSRVASQGIDDYFLGGKKIPWWVLGISSATSNFDMAGTMIIVAVVFALGYKGFLVEIRGGVGLSLAFLMVFLGKWLRRSRVMTSAEWMKIRFGHDTSGKAAHLLSAFANIILSLGMIVYFSKGAGKFLTHFIPIPDLALGPITITGEFTCTAIMVGVGLFYTLMSGLYGVVFTDVIQMLLLTFTALYVTVTAFGITPSIEIPSEMLELDLENIGASGSSLMSKDPGAWESIFSMFGICVVMWTIRTMLEGMSGIGGYTDQRFFAARTEREASLLTLEAIVLSIFRWGMVAGLVVMGMHVVQNDLAGAEMIRQDAEQVLPIVLGQLLPAGIRGLVLAGLIAAAMSTFDSTLNAGASYIVKDVYQSYVKPDAAGEDLMRVSHWATIGLCVGGVLLAAIVPNINQIWGLITMGLGAGLFIPLFLRWYWPGFTGYGFAAGTGTGILAALVFDAALGLPLYISFPTILGCSLVASVGTSMVTPRAGDEVLVRFWEQINPWGLWGNIESKARMRGRLSDEDLRARQWERMNDGISLFFSVSFQFSILLAAMSFVFHDWTKFGFFASTSVVSGVGLYFFWYRNLKSTEQCLEEDAHYDELAAEEEAARDPVAEPTAAEEEEQADATA